MTKDTHHNRIMDSLTDAPATIMELARVLHIDQRCVNTVVCDLVHDGLVERTGQSVGVSGRVQSVFGMVRTKRAA